MSCPLTQGDSTAENVYVPGLAILNKTDCPGFIGPVLHELSSAAIVCGLEPRLVHPNSTVAFTCARPGEKTSSLDADCPQLSPGRIGVANGPITISPVPSSGNWRTRPLKPATLGA